MQWNGISNIKTFSIYISIKSAGVAKLKIYAFMRMHISANKYTHTHTPIHIYVQCSKPQPVRRWTAPRQAINHKAQRQPGKHICIYICMCVQLLQDTACMCVCMCIYYNRKASQKSNSRTHANSPAHIHTDTHECNRYDWLP